MKTIPVTVEQTPEGEWWVTSSELLGTFAVGDTRDEAIENAKDLFAFTLDVDEEELRLEVIETRLSSNGDNARSSSDPS